MNKDQIAKLDDKALITLIINSSKSAYPAGTYSKSFEKAKIRFNAVTRLAHALKEVKTRFTKDGIQKHPDFKGFVSIMRTFSDQEANEIQKIAIKLRDLKYPADKNTPVPVNPYRKKN